MESVSLSFTGCPPPPPLPPSLPFMSMSSPAQSFIRALNWPSYRPPSLRPSVHPFIQLPVGAAWGRVLVGYCRAAGLPLPFLLSLVPSAGLSFSCSSSAAAAAAGPLTPSTKLAAASLPPTHPQPSPQYAGARRLSPDWWKAEWRRGGIGW